MNFGDKSKVSVVGACGHIGLPTCIFLADKHEVTGIDINSLLVSNMKNYQKFGILPYVEENFGDREKQNFGDIEFTTSYQSLNTTNTIMIIIGTPVDGTGNADLAPLLDFCNDYLIEALKQNLNKPLVILRSTVAPGTTICIKDMLEEKTCLKDGVDFYLAYCPERIAQGKAFIEMPELPQILGTFNLESEYVAHRFFLESDVKNILKSVTPTEAELAKLITNMYRYVNFAFSNEMYMLGQQYDADIHTVISTANKDYPRMNMPLPAPNSAGACLAKDGKLLVETFPFGELVNNAFLINEGMPQYIFNQAKKIKPIKRALILGMTFKKDIDDKRLSLSYKLKKILRKNNIDIVEADGFVHSESIYVPYEFKESSIDAVFVMTPHTHLVEDFKTRLVKELRSDCLIVDVWKALYPKKKTMYLKEEI